MALPQDVHDLIQTTRAYVTLHNKRDFVDVMKFRILRWEDYLDVPFLFPRILRKKDTRRGSPLI